jgi:hypothetical protein
MYYHQSTVEGKQTYKTNPEGTVEERTRKLYKLLKQHNLFGIYITTISVRPSRIYNILQEWLWVNNTPIGEMISEYEEEFIQNGTFVINRKKLLDKFNDTLSRLDEEYLVNLIEYMRRYFNSERGKNVKLI